MTSRFGREIRMKPQWKYVVGESMSRPPWDQVVGTVFRFPDPDGRVEGPAGAGPSGTRSRRGSFLGFGTKEEAMYVYDDGFAVALVLGVVALVLPALWIAWWYLADVEEAVIGSDHTRPRAV
jgi:hypothetical protein